MPNLLSSLSPDTLHLLLPYLDFWSFFRLWSTGDYQLRQQLNRTPLPLVLDVAATPQPVWPSFFLSCLHSAQKLRFFHSFRSFKHYSFVVDLSTLSRRLLVLDLRPPACRLHFGASLDSLFPILETFKLFSFVDIDLDQLLPFPSTLKSLTLDWNDLDLASVLSSLPRGLHTLHLESDLEIPSMNVNWPASLTTLFLDVNVLDHGFLIGLPALWTLHLAFWYVSPLSEDEEDGELTKEKVKYVIGLEIGEDGYAYYDIWPYLPPSLTSLSLTLNRYAIHCDTAFTPLDPKILPPDLRHLELKLDTLNEEHLLLDHGGVIGLWEALPRIQCVIIASMALDYGKIRTDIVSQVPSTYTHAHLDHHLLPEHIRILPHSITEIAGLNADLLSDRDMSLPPSLSLECMPSDPSLHDSSPPVRLRTHLPESLRHLVLPRCSISKSIKGLPSRLVSLHMHTCLFNITQDGPDETTLSGLPRTLETLRLLSFSSDPEEKDVLFHPTSASHLPPLLRSLTIELKRDFSLLHDVYGFLQHISEHLPLQQLSVIVQDRFERRGLETITPIPTFLPPSLFEIHLWGYFDSQHFGRIPRNVRSLQLHTLAGSISIYRPCDNALLPPLSRVLLK